VEADNLVSDEFRREKSLDQLDVGSKIIPLGRPEGPESLGQDPLPYFHEVVLVGVLRTNPLISSSKRRRENFSAVFFITKGL